MKYRARAFTLVEVVLAILIISAIITVLLFFYQRSVEVRQTILQETEFLAVTRMFMEQVTSELRTARVVEDQFLALEGSSNSLSFVCTTVPQIVRWIVNTNEAVALPPLSDLKRVTYRMLTGTNAFDIRGVDRVEEFLTGTAFTAGTNATEFVRTNAVSDLETNLFATNSVEMIRRPLTAQIKSLRFRYWAGTNWVENWDALELPGGVEITVGREAAKPETSPQGATDEDADVFRRVVYLPNSSPLANRVPREEAEPVF